MQATRHDDPTQPERLRSGSRARVRRPVLALIFVSAFILSANAEAIVLQVNSTADTSDNNWGDGQCSTGGVVIDPNLGPRPECTLRGAIEEANAWPGRDEVRFRSELLYPNSERAFFSPATDLPPISDPIDLDGTTAPDYDPSAGPRIVLNAPRTYGLLLLSSAADSTIRGLIFLNFEWAVFLNGTDGAWIDGCWFGISTSSVDGGIYSWENRVGIFVSILATDTWIGAKVNQDSFGGVGNTISANQVGIEVHGPNTHIIGNRIGTDSSGTRRQTGLSDEQGQNASLGNDVAGIQVYHGVGLEIGRVLEIGTTPNQTYRAKGNLISNGGGHGIEIVETSNQPTLPGMTIVANQIGTDSTGMLDFGNALSGIYVSDAAADLVIGGDVPEEANQVAGNDGDGIELGLGGVGDTTIEGNLVGVASDGVGALPNGFQGIRIDGGDPVVIRSNRVGHSPNNGILIGNDPLQSVGLTRVLDNFVGVTEYGDAIGNALAGIRVEAGDVTLRNNTIGDNRNGIELAEESVTIDVFSNHVGTDVLGRDLGNTNAGILVTSTVGGNQIGDVDKGNIVGWNGTSGIVVDQAANANLVVANHVGVHPTGLPIPNGVHGVRIRDAAGSFPVVIGSDLTTPSLDFGTRANHIFYNTQDAISIQDGTDVVARGNVISDNGGLAIDLNEDGSTPNDFGDADVGANRLQNSPEIDPANTRIDYRTGELLVEYRVTSNVGPAPYPLTIDFYFSDPTGLEPMTYLGSDSYQAADANLQRRIQFYPAVEIPPGLQNIVATSTSALSETSEVSAPVVVPEPGAAVGLAAGLLALIGGAGRRGESRRSNSC